VFCAAGFGRPRPATSTRSASSTSQTKPRRSLSRHQRLMRTRPTCMATHRSAFFIRVFSTGTGEEAWPITSFPGRPCGCTSTRNGRSWGRGLALRSLTPSQIRSRSSIPDSGWVRARRRASHEKPPLAFGRHWSTTARPSLKTHRRCTSDGGKTLLRFARSTASKPHPPASRPSSSPCRIVPKSWTPQPYRNEWPRSGMPTTSMDLKALRGRSTWWNVIRGFRRESDRNPE